MTPRGRKRKPGPRYPGGYLVQKIEPNPVVVQHRRDLLSGCAADLSAAESPMVLAFARGMITEDQLRAGDTFARAHADMFGRRFRDPGYESPDRSARDPRRVAQMADVEIVAAFDAMMDATRAQGASEARQVQAAASWHRFGQALTRDQHLEVFAAFITLAWPQWMTWEIAGRAQNADTLRRRAALLSGLDKITALLASTQRARAA